MRVRAITTISSSPRLFSTSTLFLSEPSPRRRWPTRTHTWYITLRIVQRRHREPVRRTQYRYPISPSHPRSQSRCGIRMRTRSWDAQPGQNSGIGKRSIRARGLAQNPPPLPPSGALPPSPAESSRPGSAHKKPPLTTSSRRGSLATPKKPVTQRSPPATARRQASEVRRSDDEEIVAEIVVKTKSAQDSGDMDDEASDVLSSPMSSLL